MIENWDYLLAWLTYLVAGGGMTWLAWRTTASMRAVALRDLLRWLFVVLVFTPWYAGTEYDELAPAAAVLAFDVALHEGDNRFAGGIVLLMASAVVVLVLTVRLLWQRRPGRRGRG